MLGRDEIDIVHIANFLQFDIPLSQLLGRQIEAVPLMGNVVVLAEDATEVAAREEDGSGAIVTLDAGLYAPSTTLKWILYTKSLLFLVPDLPSPKCGAMTLTFTVSAPIRQTPVFSYRLTPQSRGQRLQLRR